MNAASTNKIGIVALFSVLASISSAAEGTWTRKTDMPTARICPYTAVVDGKIYAIGGARSIDGTYLATVEAYDPTTDTWTRKTNMPTGRNGHAAAVVNGKIYVIGGDLDREVSGATVEEYNPATDTWRQRADMPTKRTFLCAAALNGRIYAIGGVTAGDPGGNPFPMTLEVYDPDTDTWTRKADMTTQRSGAGACVVDGKIYVVGGVTGDLHNAAISTVEEYDPETDTWTTRTNMPTPRMLLSTCVVNGKIYAIGGGTWNGAIYSTVEMYDPITDIWTASPDMATRRLMLSTNTVNGKIYAIGGTLQWYPCPGIATVEEYDPWPLIVDFNGNGTVDIQDLLRLIESWGQDDPVTDIAPPFGDGVVDALDLEVLMSFWGQEVDDPTLVAHWKLDEAEDIIAGDSAGNCDGTVCGNPLWQPGGGVVGGALALDGNGDFVGADFALDPSEGPFSVLAWIHGGAPGQVVVSQIDGKNWLMVDALAGTLATGLIPPTSRPPVPPLVSDAVLADGQWHRVGFAWDGVSRSLYVDDILVAHDIQDALASCSGAMNIGCGGDMALSTFWSGTIDDIRIYNRAVLP